MVPCRAARAVSPLSRGLSRSLRLSQMHSKPNRHRHRTGREGAKTRAWGDACLPRKTMPRLQGGAIGQCWCLSPWVGSPRSELNNI